MPGLCMLLQQNPNLKLPKNLHPMIPILSIKIQPQILLISNQSNCGCLFMDKTQIYSCVNTSSQQILCFVVFNLDNVYWQGKSILLLAASKKTISPRKTCI